MPKFRLSRRSVLKGAGSIAIGLPWLEVMRPERANAQTAIPAKRFIGIYQPGGVVMSKWRPTGSESSFTLSPILAPLAPMQSKILVVDGLDLKSAAGGEQHQGGICALLTGTPQAPLPVTASSYASGPSIDQVLVSRLSVDKRKASLPLAVRWATGKSHGLLHPINSLNFDAVTKKPMSPLIDPVTIFNDLFGTVGSVGEAEAKAARQKSILDYVDRRHVALSMKLGAADRAKLDEHLTKLREVEKRVAIVAPTNSMCTKPMARDTSGYNPRSGVNSSDDGSIRDTSTDAVIPTVGELFMDMIVMAFACDFTGVATLQWTDTEAKHTFPWLQLSEHHHYYQHDGGGPAPDYYRVAEIEKICNWYTKQHLYLLQQLQKVTVGDHTLLDETVVFVGSEISHPQSHSKVDMPLLLAGGGGMRTGRWLRYNHQSHNDLLVAILNLFGDARTTFGDPRYVGSARLSPTLT